MAVPQQQYTLEEVKRHDGQQEPTVWVLFQDTVVDVTKYLDEHPGGRDAIEEYAGTDIRKPFVKQGHSNDAIQKLLTLKIGELVDADKSANRDKAGPSGIQNGEQKKKKRSRFFFC